MDYKWEAIKYTIVRRTIETICDLICTFPKSTTFVPGDKSDNWLESLVGFYIFGTIASDWHLIVDSKVWINISNALRVMLDGYTKDLWQTTINNENKGHKANTDSVSCDIMEAFMIIGRTDDAANLQPWSSDEVHQAINGDHHDNMFRRLQVRPFLYWTILKVKYTRPSDSDLAHAILRKNVFYVLMEKHSAPAIYKPIEVPEIFRYFLWLGMYFIDQNYRSFHS